ncbi:hypothetical protein V8F33_006299 [Rhypophila sp. PSN 637]
MAAERVNQTLNSMALVPARYTLEAVDVSSHLVSAYLLAVCQALGLRALGIDRQNGMNGKGNLSQGPDAAKYIGRGSRKMYQFARKNWAFRFWERSNWHSKKPWWKMERRRVLGCITQGSMKVFCLGGCTRLLFNV